MRACANVGLKIYKRKARKGEGKKKYKNTESSIYTNCSLAVLSEALLNLATDVAANTNHPGRRCLRPCQIYES